MDIYLAMKYNKAGKSGLSLSEIGFGCMSLKGNEKEDARLIHHAVDAGINFFDTADLYDKGENEIRLGKTVRSIRKQLVIATKVGNQWREDGSGWDWNPRKEYILGAVEQSLQRLQTDYIDLYQLHGGTINDPIDETIEAFELLQAQGKIRYYGISSIRPNVIREYCKRSRITTVMMQFSLLDQRPAEECLPLLTKSEIGVLARGPLAQGLLINKPPKEYITRPVKEVQQAAAAIDALSTDLRNPVQTAIRFVLQEPGITSAVIGIGKAGQLQDAVHAAAAPPLTPEEISTLRRTITPNYYTEHR